MHIENERNYLRVRGEYIEPIRGSLTLVELPPRARRIPVTLIPLRCRGWNYLRVRGEYATL